MHNHQKIHVKIGNAEFSAEGSEGLVKEQFSAFLELLRRDPPADTKETPTAKPAESFKGGNGSESPAAEVDSEIVARVYAQDKDGDVSLLVLPKTADRAGDALMLLLYGYRILKGKNDVLGGELLRAAKTSGLSLDRVDKTLPSSLTTKAGLKRGSRYGLNNVGLAKAKELLQGILS